MGDQEGGAVGPLIMSGATPDEVWPLVRDYHYAGTMPSAGTAQYTFAWRRPGGLFGDAGEPVAAAIYSVPVNRNWPLDALELQRLVRHPALERHLSEFVSWTLRWLRANTSAPFVLSYADSGQGHHGGIYQATGFRYVRLSRGDRSFIDSNGKRVHGKSIFDRYGTRSVGAVLAKHADWQVVRDGDKHLYVKPLRQRESALMRRFGWKALPYPKPANRPEDERATRASEAGATPAVRSSCAEAA